MAILGDTTATQVTSINGFIGNGSGLTSLNASNISSGTLDAARLATSGASAGSYGPSAAVTGTNNTTMNVPYITVDAHGRVTSISNKVYTSKDTVYTHPTSAGNIHLPSGGASGNFLKWSSAGTGKWESLTKTEITTALGYTPPTTNTTYSAFTAATSSAAGATGLVPAPAKGKQDSFLRGNATWATASDIINTLSEGSSPATAADYVVCQYAGGGTTTTTYHRRPVSKVLDALTKAQVTTALGYTPPTTNTTYSAGTGLSLSSTTINHSNSVTAGTVGTSSATSGSTLAVPYVTYDAQGHITATGTHTHTVSGFLTSHQTIKQNGVTGATGNCYGACSTAAATAAKAVSITAGTPALEAGLKVTVKFTHANTANSPTLNVNSLGAKNIFHNGAQITSGTNKALLAGVCDFVYDGTQFHLVGNYHDTVYTHPTTSGNKHIPSGGSSGQILKYSADGTAVWAAEYSYTHPTTAGNKHIPTGGSSGQVLKYSASGTAAWATLTAGDVGAATSGHNHSGVYTPYAASVGSNQKFIYTNSSGALTAANFEIWVTDD